ncbi:unnamed protein product [Darwinula stevensoni]|uniref:AIP/AIPL N-terminal FKBP-type PPIase domain-containing protein n=1 Tax=Darwinula stevensoni TaxID=69355 RepID=A0A7R9A9B6_9CRUS|nr:unnamed protein product [Darwinula stevensoni]CAG0897267.1 unnamed protein product [Darwinula stevensoni]
MADPPVKKALVYPGKKEVEFKNEAKAIFHFTTFKCDQKTGEYVEVDNSRKFTKPMELIIGRSFKLEVWETCIKTMNLEEVSDFFVEKHLVTCYPLVAKTLRDAFLPGEKKKSHQHEGHKGHRCGAAMMHEKTGYKDLDALMDDPTDLKFRIELLKVEQPGEFEKESWIMKDEEKLESVGKLKEKGNSSYKEGDHDAAAKIYAEAIGRLEQLLLREKPGTVESNHLEDLKIPLLLNYSQCKLLSGEHYEVIEHTTQVLKREPENVKALFRRGKAHAAVWNPKEAEDDFEKAASLDPSLREVVRKELDLLRQRSRERDALDKDKFKMLF